MKNRNAIKVGKFLQMLSGSRWKSDYPQVYEKYYGHIENLLRGFDDSTLEGLSSLEGLTDKTEFDSFFRFDTLRGETKDSKEQQIDSKFTAILAEVTTWHDREMERLQEIKKHLDQNGDAVRKAIDGETISKWTAIVSALFTFALSAVTLFLKFGQPIDYNEIAFVGTLGGAIITLAVSAIAGICNLVLTKKFHSSYGVSIAKAAKAKNLIVIEEEYEKEINEADINAGNTEAIKKHYKGSGDISNTGNGSVNITGGKVKGNITIAGKDIDKLFK